MSDHFIVTFTNGRRFRVPVKVVAEDASKYWARHDGISFEECLADTLKLFQNSEYDLVDWAKNNMDWKDLEPHAKELSVEERYLDTLWMEAVLGLEP